MRDLGFLNLLFVCLLRDRDTASRNHAEAALPSLVDCLSFKKIAWFDFLP